MPESYNHMDPQAVGNTMRSVVSELSGRGNILDKAEQAGLLLDKDVAGSVLARIKQMENEARLRLLQPHIVECVLLVFGAYCRAGLAIRL
jgi:isopropylmalate/homocitrate/citramalate synthase